MSDGAGESAALDVAGVSHRFGARAALSDVSIRVERGRFMALLGPNGAGKTTLFSVITRLYANQDGRVSIFGHGLDREPSRALARLGVVFQARTLDTDLTVEQNLLYHASLHGIARRAAKARIAALLARVGLSDRRDDKVRTLSGGQSRRIEIARSLVHEPKLLLLDEPHRGARSRIACRHRRHRPCPGAGGGAFGPVGDPYLRGDRRGRRRGRPSQRAHRRAGNGGVHR